MYGNIVIQIFRLCGTYENSSSSLSSLSKDSNKTTNQLQQQHHQSQNINDNSIDSNIKSPTSPTSPNFPFPFSLNSSESPHKNIIHPLKLLDETGRWTVTAFINVDAITDIDAINVATADLDRFKMEVSGLLDLEIPDRNCFDSRMKRR